MSNVETRYFGIFHRSNTSAYDQGVLSFYALEFDLDKNEFVDQDAWTPMLEKLKQLRAERPYVLGDFVIKRVDNMGTPLDRPAAKVHDDYAGPPCGRDISKMEDAIDEKRLKRQASTCPLSPPYWYFDDGQPSTRFWSKESALFYASRVNRDPSTLKMVETGRPKKCPTIGVCPRSCYTMSGDYYFGDGLYEPRNEDWDYSYGYLPREPGDETEFRWQKAGEKKIQGVGDQWLESRTIVDE